MSVCAHDPYCPGPGTEYHDTAMKYGTVTNRPSRLPGESIRGQKRRERTERKARS